MKKKDVAKVKRGVVQIPMVGTIAFGYNKPGCNLKLTQEQAVRVAMGKIRNWKDSVVSPASSPGCTVLTAPAPPRPSPTPCRPSPKPGPWALANP